MKSELRWPTTFASMLLFAGGVSAAPPVPQTQPSADAGLSFKDVTAQAGMDKPGFGWRSYHDNLVAADWDGDGDIDILACVSPHDKGPYVSSARAYVNLFKETGQLKFEDRTDKIFPNEINKKCEADGCPFFMDIDADGDLDLCSITDEGHPVTYRNDGHGLFSLENWGFRIQVVTVKDYNGHGFLDVAGEGYLYTNDGTGKFTESKETPEQGGIAGILIPNKVMLTAPPGVKLADDIVAMSKDEKGHGRVYFFWTRIDVNGDGVPDWHLVLHQPYSFEENRFYAGAKDGTYTDITADIGLPSSGEIGFADVDSDGKMDAYLNVNNPTAGIYLGDGHGHFKKAQHSDADAILRNVVGGCPTTPRFVDLNNDGILDMVTYEYRAGNGSAIFLGQGEGKFKLIQKTGSACGQLIIDLDNDGLLDVVASGAEHYGANAKVDEGIIILKNTSTPAGSYLRITCKGSAKNPFGVGAKVSAYAAGAAPDSPAIATASMESDGNPLHLGLGKIDKVELKAEFSDGKVVEMKDVPVNQLVKIEEK